MITHASVYLIFYLNKTCNKFILSLFNNVFVVVYHELTTLRRVYLARAACSALGNGLHTNSIQVPLPNWYRRFVMFTHERQWPHFIYIIFFYLLTPIISSLFLFLQQKLKCLRIAEFVLFFIFLIIFIIGTAVILSRRG